MDNANEVDNGKLEEMDERIRKRAYEIYLARGGAPGRELDDWLQAEQEILVDEASEESFPASDPPAY
jgi:hypothetical protein